MSHQLNEAIDHINRQDAIPFEGDFKCVIDECGEQFDKGFGYECNEFKGDRFCFECFNNKKHTAFYGQNGFSGDEEKELTFKKI